MDINELDVLIVGGGAAGASLAFNLCMKSKLKIALIDRAKRDLIGKKTCGNIFFGDWDPNHPLTPREDEIYTIWKDQYLNVHSENTQIKTLFTNGIHADRLKYTQRVLNDAVKHGLKIIAGRKVLRPIIENDTMVGIIARNQETKEEEIYKAKLIADASGFAHVVRRNIPETSFPLLDKKISYMVDGYREILKAERDFEKQLYMIVPDFLPVGSFFWILGQGKGRVNAGMYLRNHEDNNEKIKLLDAFKKILHEHFYAKEEYDVIDASGCPIPSIIPLTNIVGNGFVTFGEAGAQTSPIIGDGIRQALETGELISEEIIKAFEKDDLSESGLWGINKLVKPLMITNVIAFLRLIAFKEFGNNGLRIMLKKIPEQIGSFFLNKDFSLLEQLNAGLKLRGTGLLGGLLKIQSNTKKVKKIFLKYPQSPVEYPEWKTTFNDFIETLNIPKKIPLIISQ